MQSVFVALLIVAFFAALYRVTVEYDRALWLCVCIVTINWILNTTYVLTTGNTDATICFLLVDTLSLVLIWKIAEGLAIGQLLASSYAGQILAHGLHLSTWDDPYRYWQLLTLIGIGQLLLLAAWAVSKRDGLGGLQ
jgi:hypothetical protein